MNKPISQKTLVQTMLTSAGWLALFVMFGIGLLLITKSLTHDAIEQAHKIEIKKAFDAVLPDIKYNNHPFQDVKTIVNQKVFQTQKPIIFYRVRLNNKPVALIVKTIAPDGYNGNIEIMMAVTTDGRLTGVRIISHKETPGLGDKIDLKKSPWVLQFNGMSLNDNNHKAWHVRKDGGQFDQFTGATITPRAVVKAVKKTLQYINEQGSALYD